MTLSCKRHFSIINEILRHISAPMEGHDPKRVAFIIHMVWLIITLKPRQNCHHFADDIFKCIFLNDSLWISLKISLMCVPKVRINNISGLVKVMAWRRSSDKPLSEPMMVWFTDAYMRHPASVSFIMPSSKGGCCPDELVPNHLSICWNSNLLFEWRHVSVMAP